MEEIEFSRWLFEGRLMPYPCSQFCAGIRFDNRFGIKLGDSFHVNHTIDFVKGFMV